MDLATGQNLLKQKKFLMALKHFKKLLELNPNNIDINFYLGRVYSEIQDSKNSIKYYLKYLDSNKNSINCLTNLAILYLNVGEKKESEKTFKKIIKLNKKNVLAYYGLFTLSNDLLDQNDFNFLEQILSKEKEISLGDKSVINFLLSKKEKNLNNIEREIKFLKLYHKQSFDSNFEYNKQSQFYYDNVLANFNDKLIFDNIDFFNNNYKPIFIVGLPRSGSTLIESLLTSGKNKIKTYGESNFFNVAFLNQIKDKIYKKNLELENFNFKIDLSRIIKDLEDRYDLKENNENERIFIDKSLENVFNIELILKVFPGAKFIHSKRKLNDAVLSIYFSMLPELSWTLSLDTIKDYINKYQKIINYYKNKFPDKIFDVDLDEFTFKSDLISKEIFQFCELTWTKESLDFYQRKDLFSKTLSSSQIRKRISKQNQSNYNKYYFLLD